jgi:hypothetical protein
VSLLQERFSQLIEAEVDRRLEAEAALRSERERQHRELLLLEKEQVDRLITGPGSPGRVVGSFSIAECSS